MKRTFSFLLLYFITANVFSSPVNVEKAKQIGQSFFQAKNTIANPATLNRVAYSDNISQETPFYIFNRNNGGFVIVSGEDAVMPILGYSQTQSFDQTTMPENVRWWLESYSRQIQFARENNSVANSQTQKEWNDLLTGKMQKAPAAENAVNPLLTTTWNQGYPYNNYCPNNDWTGCTVTAMTQIMKYWNYPAQGTGSHSYTHPVYGVLSADFSQTTFNWAQMPNAINSSSTAAQIDAVATLMYICGVATDMNYSPNGSGAYTLNAALALVNYFHYDTNIQMKYRNDCDLTTWQNIIKTELNASRPVHYAGYNDASGHAFVCDGYNDNNYFHFNWGWGGASNGYFVLTTLLGEDGVGFNYNQEIIVGIQPEQGGHSIAITCPNFQVNGKLTTNEDGSFSITLKNSGTSDYNSYLSLEIYNFDDAGNLSGDLIVFEDIVNIAAGETTILNYSTNITLPQGIYFILLANDANNDYNNVNWNYLYFSKVQVNVISQTDNLLNNQISVYPNTTGDGLNISNYNGNGVFSILDLSGKKIFSGKIDGNLIDISFLPTGVFILKIDGKQYKFLKK